MDRQQQGFAAGAFVLGAAFLGRGFVGSVPSPGAAPETSVARETARATTLQKRETEGPWIASCNYWRLSTRDDGAVGAAPAVSGTGKINLAGKGLNLEESFQLTADDDGPGDCDQSTWGIPRDRSNGDILPRPFGKQSSGISPQLRDVPITALLLTVPDPVHSSFSLDFDREMDVLSEAAADNGYVLSHYWLPWKVAAESGKSGAPSADELKRADEREKQPGLIVLRSITRPATESQTIYLFVVAETPALGINGPQMRNALRDEALLRGWGATLSLRDPAHGADVIGPIYSGSASSLRAALQHADLTGLHVERFHVAGVTASPAAAVTLSGPNIPGAAVIDYMSFGEDVSRVEQLLRDRFCDEKHGLSRLAFLVERSTVFGLSISTSVSDELKTLRLKTGREPPSACQNDDPLVIRFPREIALLRSAQQESKTSSDTVSEVDPYLHLSLKTSGAEDTIAHASRAHTPVSQEAEWMSIARQMREHRVETVSISASNVLDELFLARVIHRDLPDVRVITSTTNDLLFARLGETKPYVGTLSITAYPVFSLLSSTGASHPHVFADGTSEQIYDAVSYSLWSAAPDTIPALVGYQASTSGNPKDALTLYPPPLWMTVAGRDGYYPLGILDECSSAKSGNLPVLQEKRDSQAASALEEQRSPCARNSSARDNSVFSIFSDWHPSYPGLSWYLLSAVLALLCLGHTLALLTAHFWSPTTRELCIESSDEPHRRAVYINIGTAMLFSMSAMTAIPAIAAAAQGILAPQPALEVAVLTLCSGFCAVGSTLWKTRHFFGKPICQTGQPASYRQFPPGRLQDFVADGKLYPFFNWLAVLVTVVLLVIWALLCTDVHWQAPSTFVGHFFSWRCLYPASGVSPLWPVLLILINWYFWALFQTKRLRFSENSRPMMPGDGPAAATSTPLYVSDTELGRCDLNVNSCLYENVTCLLITRQLVHRAVRPACPLVLNLLLGAFYLVLFFVFVFELPVHSLDHFLRSHQFGLTLYEFLISALFYPLLVIAITGSVRMFVVWNSLRSGLLEPLERSPLRYAFSRRTNVAWTTMFKQNGVLEYWRDMTRSNESIRQIVGSADVEREMERHDRYSFPVAEMAEISLNRHINTLVRDQLPNPGVDTQTANYLLGCDVPAADKRSFLNLLCAIECDYAQFAEALLHGLLIPYWTRQRQALVEGEPDAEHARDAKIYDSPKEIQLGEEFLVLRYVSLIRALLINLRQLMTFVSFSFVLALFAWNSYPFQPRQWIDAVFTALLLGFSAAGIWVFAQMHRNPILSRITGTQATELGAEFYLRIATFGAVPVLTWLASQFPAIGSTVGRLLQSGSEIAK